MRLVRKADNFSTFMCPLSRNSGNLNRLEHKEPVQALLAKTQGFGSISGYSECQKCITVVPLFAVNIKL